jgi:UDP-GlcNAc:undecaprenyl-phosphate GlcNAc-1-phosphate transferase
MNCDLLTFDARLQGALAMLVSAWPAFLASLVATLVSVPIARAVALRTGVVDAPDGIRKLHGRTVAYLGGVGVFVGAFVGIIAGAIASGADVDSMPPVPFSIVLGMVAITFTGLADDIWKFDARLKVAGQLVAAAALAIDEIGVNVATGLLAPVMGSPGETILALGGVAITNATVFYWVGTALVAVFVLGGCNAANLLDGLDGLLSGITAVMCIGLLLLSLVVVFALPPDLSLATEGMHPMAGARITLCVSLLGACLGFLVFNFNPASIFLGDAGSLLIGFMSVAIIMSFANLAPFSCPYVARAAVDPAQPGPAQLPLSQIPGQQAGYEGFSTVLVMSGLAMFGLPILDTTLAMVRRKRAGVPFSVPDANHLHHRVKRALGGSVRRAVLSLYAMELGLVVLGLGCGATLLLVGGRLLWPFLFLVAAFLVLVAIGLRGVGGAPTKVPASGAPASPAASQTPGTP